MLPLIKVHFPGSVSRQRLDQASLGRRQQLREDLEAAAPSGSEAERRVNIDADDMPARREPQLPLAHHQHVPRLMLLLADQGVLAVGTQLPIRSAPASGAGQAVVAAGAWLMWRLR